MIIINIQEIDQKIETLSRLRDVLDTNPKNTTELIFLKYIELVKCSEVASYMNRKGYKVEGVRKPRKYIAIDITEVLESYESISLVETDIYDLVMKMKKSRRFLDKFMFEG